MGYGADIGELSVQGYEPDFLEIACPPDSLPPMLLWAQPSSRLCSPLVLRHPVNLCTLCCCPRRYDAHGDFDPEGATVVLTSERESRGPLHRHICTCVQCCPASARPPALVAPCRRFSSAVRTMPSRTA